MHDATLKMLFKIKRKLRVGMSIVLLRVHKNEHEGMQLPQVPIFKAEFTNNTN